MLSKDSVARQSRNCLVYHGVKRPCSVILGKERQLRSEVVQSGKVSLSVVS